MIWKGVHKRVNTEGPRLLSSERLAGKVGPWLATPTLTGRCFSTLIKISLNDSLNHRKWLIVPKLFVWCGLCWTPAFLPRVWKFGTCWAEAASVTSPQWKPWALGHWWASSRQHFIFVCCHNLLLEEFSTSRVTPAGENSWKLMSGFLQIWSHEPFPFANFALCLSDDVICSHEYDCMLSPVSSPSESLNPGKATHITPVHHSSLRITQRE